MTADTSAKRVAVIVRGHFESDKFSDLVAQLYDPSSHDIIIAASELQGPIKVGDYPHMRCDVDALQSLGFDVDQQRFFYDFGDAVLYLALKRFPDYDYYVMLEYDVEFSGDAAAFVRGLITAMEAENLDLVGPRVRPQGPWWPHWALASTRYEQVWSVFLPVMALSRRAVQFLYQRRIEEGPSTASFGERVFSEAFVASALHAGGYAIRDMNTIEPASYTDTTFYYGEPMLAGSPPCRRTDIGTFHPVYPAREFLKAHLDRAHGTGTLLQYAASLRQTQPTGIAEGVRSDWLAHADASLASLQQERGPKPDPEPFLIPVVVLPRRPRWPNPGLTGLDPAETLTIGGRTVAQHVVDHLLASGVTTLLAADVPGDEAGQDLGATVWADAARNEATAVKALMQASGWPRLMICYGDCLTDANVHAVLRTHVAAASLGTVLAVRPSPLLLALTGDIDPIRHDQPSLDEARINGGFIILEASALDHCEPGETLEAVLARLHEQGGLATHAHTGFWEAVQTAPVLATATQLWNDGQAPWVIQHH